MISHLWACASMLRRLLVRPRKLTSRVIGVGNIQVGGAGKTPMVAWIARNTPGTVAILLRGYKKKAPGSRIFAAHEPLSALWGDEAALLRQLVPGAIIGVGASRLALARMITADTIILDDAFQYPWIYQDVRLCLVTNKRFGDVFFRDWPWTTCFADFGIGTKGGSGDCRVRFVLPPGRGKVFLVSALADPNCFEQSVRDAGYDIVGHEMLPDHAEVVDLGILQLRAEQIGARLAMTGKDAVKICEPHNSIIFEPEVVFDAGEEELRRVLWP